MTFVCKPATTARELKAMLDRIEARHLDLPLEFVHIDRGALYTLEHIGREAIAEDVVPGDKGAFLMPNATTPECVAILLAFHAETEINRVNRVSALRDALQCAASAVPPLEQRSKDAAALMRDGAASPVPGDTAIGVGARVHFGAGSRRVHGQVTELRGDVAVVEHALDTVSGQVPSRSFIHVGNLTRDDQQSAEGAP